MNGTFDDNLYVIVVACQFSNIARQITMVKTDSAHITEVFLDNCVQSFDGNVLLGKRRAEWIYLDGEDWLSQPWSADL